ncbi:MULTISPECIES: ribbon-helix-helix protein, CopG family [unclassified Haloferax]|uniref:ribbon-helix-helix protein, CopG family n=1 Tax=unclassified Haloferax TaxID=2625095 RepID=UPI000E271C11|nr:CopG family transcriptional regulator [Haloferax sp. Atlit-24N]RDZ56720.1 CopG family transcriptional regulator [Haloferax sp. Atlit-12N]RLM33541.1 ribbon-helix-helix protein, CopG family [Haloferax sp. Atlit-109R]RLM40880.1 ribbon-helix-helix protein, CopG family [Haloferax sp. Atlit-105R]
MYMSTKRVNFRLPEELVAHADIAAEVTHKNRTEILIEALRQYLEEKESDESFREAVVELYLDDHIEFEKLVEIIGRQDAEAVRASKEVLDRGEELADKLADL